MSSIFHSFLVLDISLMKETYTLFEYEDVVITVCKNIDIAKPVEVIVSALTVENASMILPYIPEYISHSPNQAS